MPVFEIMETPEFLNRFPSWGLSRRICFRTFLVLITAFGAMIVPRFGLFINAIGAFACTALAFVLPVKIYDITHKDEMSRKRKCLHYILVAFGVIAGLISFFVSVNDLIHAFSEKDETGE